MRQTESDGTDHTEHRWQWGHSVNYGEPFCRDCGTCVSKVETELASLRARVAEQDARIAEWHQRGRDYLEELATERARREGAEELLREIRLGLANKGFVLSAHISTFLEEPRL